MEDIIIAESQAINVPKLWICDLLISKADLLKLGLEDGGHFADHFVCTLQFVRSLHLLDVDFKGWL